MEKFLKKVKEAFAIIGDAFVGCACLIDEDRRVNHDGHWNKYWERKNRNAERRSGNCNEK